MYNTVRSNLAYQKHAFSLLYGYLCSEQNWLQVGHFAKVEELGQRIRFLVQNLTDARIEMRTLLKEGGLSAFTAAQEEEFAAPLRALTSDIDGLEEQCRGQARRNKQLIRMLDEEEMHRIGAMFGVLIGRDNTPTMRVQ